jgi:predicted metal-dependent HD superfamily phosphohydrolase
VPGDALAAELLARREPQRRYHTLQHLRECLGHLEAVLDQVPDPAAIELALWFHDAVYELVSPALRHQTNSAALYPTNCAVRRAQQALLRAARRRRWPGRSTN